jgi:hypothetical protein
VDQTQIDQRIQELRDQYPAMFSHPELKPGEICLGHQPHEFLALNIPGYRNKGLVSVRISDTSTPGQGIFGWGVEHFAIFADAQEYVKVMAEIKPA